VPYCPGAQASWDFTERLPVRFPKSYVRRRLLSVTTAGAFPGEGTWGRLPMLSLTQVFRAPHHTIAL
jgi:hypothetical protein